jgi:hypothetical protein
MNRSVPLPLREGLGEGYIKVLIPYHTKSYQQRTGFKPHESWFSPTKKPVLSPFSNHLPANRIVSPSRYLQESGPQSLRRSP